MALWLLYKKVLSAIRRSYSHYPTLHEGIYNNSYVMTLQKMLGITADGDFGPKTLTAVKKFQKEHKLVADGIVGAETWNALLS